MKRQNKKKLLAAVFAGVPALLLTRGAVGQTTWTGGDSNLWNDMNNWSSATVPGSGSTAGFASTSSSNNNVSLGGGAQAIGTILFDTTPTTFDLGVTSGDTFVFDSGGAITLNSDVSTAQTISAAIQTTGSMSINNGASGGLTFGGPISINNGGALTVNYGTNNAVTTTFNGTIADGTGGASSLSLVATSTNATNNNFIFNTANTYSGGTTLNANTGATGAFQIGTNSPFGSGKVVVQLGNNGAVSAAQFTALNSSDTIANQFDLAAGIQFSGNNNLTFTGPFNLLYSAAAGVVNSGIPAFADKATGVVTIGTAGGTSTISLGNPVSNGGSGTAITALFNGNAGQLILNDTIVDPSVGAHGNVEYGGGSGAIITVNGLNTYSGSTYFNGFSTVQFSTSYNPGGTSGPFGLSTLNFNNSNNNPMEPIGGSQVLANPISVTGGGFSMVQPTAAGTNNLTFAGPITFAANGRYLANGINGLQTTNYGGNFYLGLAGSNASTLTLPNATASTTVHLVGIAGPLIVNDVIKDSGGFVGNVQINDQTQDVDPVILAGPNTFSGGVLLGGNTVGMGVVGVGISTVGNAGAVTSGPFGTGIITMNNTDALSIQPIGADRTVANAIKMTSGFIVSSASASLDPTGPHSLILSGPITQTTSNGRYINNNLPAGTTLTFGLATNPSTITLGSPTVNANFSIQSQPAAGVGGGITIINDVLQNGGGTQSIGLLNLQLGGTVYLNAVNTWSGGLEFQGSSGATLVVSSDANMGSATGGITFIGAGTLLDTGTFTTARSINLGTNTGTLGGVIDVGSGQTLTLTGGIGNTGDLTKGTNSGTLQLAQAAGGSISGNVNVNGGTLLVGPTGGETGPFGIGGTLTINNGALVSVAAGVSSNAVTNSAATLTINGSGQLNLANSALITNTSPSTVRQYLINGYNAGAWNGTGGISSVSAATNAGQATALGYTSGTSSVGMALGLTAGQTLVKYTIYGDANLDGKVDISDLNIVLSNFASGKPPTWDTGDFTYAGQTDISDLNIVLSHYSQSAPTTIATPSTAHSSVKAAAANSVVSSGPQTLTGAASPSVALGSIALDVNSITGDAVMVPTGNPDVVDTQEASSSGNLLPNNWMDLSNFYGVPHWDDVSVQTINLAEYDASYIGRHNFLTMTAPIDYGDIFNTSGPRDLTFEYGIADTDGTDVDTETGLIVYSPVPEPTTLGLMGLAAAGLMGRRRRKNIRTEQ